MNEISQFLTCKEQALSVSWNVIKTVLHKRFCDTYFILQRIFDIINVPSKQQWRSSFTWLAKIPFIIV